MSTTSSSTPSDRELFEQISFHITNFNNEQACEMLLAHPSPKMEELALSTSVFANNTEMLKELLNKNFSGKTWSRSLCQAVGRQHARAVELLLPKANIEAQSCEALRSAATHGGVEIFDMLVAHWKPPCKNIVYVAANAAHNGHLPILKRCLELDTFDLEPSFVYACQHGQLKIIQYLMPLCDDPIKARGIFMADLTQKNDVVDYLWPIVSTNPHWEEFAPGQYTHTPESHLSRLKKAQDEKNLLTTIVRQSEISAPRKM